jgi:hypothetical protein
MNVCGAVVGVVQVGILYDLVLLVTFLRNLMFDNMMEARCVFQKDQFFRIRISVTRSAAERSGLWCGRLRQK